MTWEQEQIGACTLYRGDALGDPAYVTDCRPCAD